MIYVVLQWLAINFPLQILNHCRYLTSSEMISGDKLTLVIGLVDKLMLSLSLEGFGDC